MSRPTFVIPSYWGRSWSEPWNPDDDLYDHPTPIDEEGTLARALESFSVLEDQDFNLVVLGVAAYPEIRERVRAKIEDILLAFRGRMRVALFTESEAAALRAAMRDDDTVVDGDPAGVGLDDLVSLSGYSNVRNACLIAAALAGSDIAIFFDDDEIMRDPVYLAKALEFIGTEHEGHKILGVAGYYLRPEADTWRVPHPEDAHAAVWDGAGAMNRAFERVIGTQPRLKRTPFTFGGNMVVHRRLWEKVCFDPNVTRGEDIDFLVNAKMFGHHFFLDNQLFIKHLPPPSRTPGWRGFRENVVRFVYSREKLLAQKPVEGLRWVEIDELDPYPGEFMKDDLQEKIFKMVTLMAIDYLESGYNEGVRESLETLAVAAFRAKPEHDPFDWYLAYRERWQRLMGWLDAHPEAGDSLSAELDAGLA